MQTSGRTLDYAAGVYDILSPLMTFGQEERIGKKVIGLLNLKKNIKVLDIGCGTGTLSIEIASSLSDNPDSLVVGLDAAPKMIAHARRKIIGLCNIRFDDAASEILPYSDGSFDCAISTFFFHHINFELKKKSLAQIWRVLKDNGELAVADVDIPYNFFGRLCAWSGYFLFRQQEIKENIRGKLEEAFNLSPFRSWQRVSSHLGYVSVFKLIK